MNPSFIEIPSLKGYLCFDKVLTEKDKVSDDTVVILMKIPSNEGIDFKISFPESLKIIDSDIQYIQRNFFNFTQEQIRALRQRPVHCSAWHFSARQKQQEMPHQKNTSVFHCLTGSDPEIMSLKNLTLMQKPAHASDGRKKPEKPHQEKTATFYCFTGSEPVIKLIREVCVDSIETCYLSHGTLQYENMDFNIKKFLGGRVLEMPTFISFTVNGIVIKFETDNEPEVKDFFKQGLTNKEILFNYLKSRGTPIADDYPLSDVRSGNDEAIEEYEIKLNNIRSLLKRLTSRLTESDRELSPGCAERLSKFASAYSAVTKAFDFSPAGVTEIKIHSLNDMRKLYKELDSWTMRVKKQLNLAKFDTLFSRRTFVRIQCVSDILNFSAKQTEPEIPRQEKTATFIYFTGSAPVIELIKELCGDTIKENYTESELEQFETMDDEYKATGFRAFLSPENFTVKGRKLETKEIIQKIKALKELKLNFEPQKNNKDLFFRFLRDTGTPIEDDYPLSDVFSGNDESIGKIEVILSDIRTLLKQLTSLITKSDRELPSGRAERLSGLAGAYFAVTKAFDFSPAGVTEIKIHSLNDMLKLYKELDDWAMRVQKQLNLAKFDSLYLLRTSLRISCVNDILNFSAWQNEPEILNPEKSAVCYCFTGSEPVIKFIKMVCGDTIKSHYSKHGKYEVLDKERKAAGGRHIMPPDLVTVKGRVIEFNNPKYPKINKFWTSCAENPNQNNKELVLRFLKDTTQIDDNYQPDLISSDNDESIRHLEILLEKIGQWLDKLIRLHQVQSCELPSGNIGLLSRFASAFSAVTEAFDFSPSCVTEITIHSFDDILKLYEELKDWLKCVKEQLNLAQFDSLYLSRITLRVFCVRIILEKYQSAWTRLAYNS